MDNPVFMNRKQTGRRLQEKIPKTDIGMRIFWNIDLPYVRTGSEPMYVTEGNTFVFEVPPRKPNEPLKVYFSHSREVYRSYDPIPRRPAFSGKLRSAMKGSRARADGWEWRRPDSVTKDTGDNKPTQTIPFTKCGKHVDAPEQKERYISWREYKDEKRRRSQTSSVGYSKDKSSDSSAPLEKKD